MNLYLRLFLYFLLISLLGCGSTSVNKKTFTNADIAGSWELIHFGKLSGAFGSYGSLDISSSGTISGGIVNNFGVDTQKFTGGKFHISTEGVITGDIDVFLPDSSTYEKLIIYKGQMSSDKDIIIYSASFNLGRKGIGVLIKKSEDFVQNDLNGIWVFPIDGLFTISINNSPEIASCFYISPSSDTLQCLGEISLSPSGNILSKFQFINSGPFSTDLNGRLNSSKNIMILAGGISTRFEGVSTLAFKKIKEISLDVIKGNWNIFIPSDADTIYGMLEIENNGKIINGSWTNSKNKSGVFTGEIKITDSEHGNISGIINLSKLMTYSVFGGGMSSSGDIISLYTKDKFGIPLMVLMIRT